MAAKNLIRRATHAGSWYLSDGEELNEQLSGFLANVPIASFEHGPVPIPDARIIIAPHAGYSYSGATSAWAYKFWDVSKIRRIFLLGPSHHVYLTSCALSQCSEYETPLGNIPIDIETVKQLQQTGRFELMSKVTDEDEHSLEMHLPFIYKILSESRGGIRPLVPMMIGALSASAEREFGELLAPYLRDPENGFIISTDFCHWGTRFGYTTYVDDPECSKIRSLSSSSAVSKLNSEVPIYRSIEIMDYKGMDVSNGGSHAEWMEYLSRTKNTICGRHPLGLLISSVEYLRANGVELDLDKRKPAPGSEPEEIVAKNGLTGEDALKYSFGKIYWIQYKQSSKCMRISDSSVSYASGFAKA
ncbi:memo-like protein-domain-containing protein [Dipodascopsis uninucleata]